MAPFLRGNFSLVSKRVNSELSATLFRTDERDGWGAADSLCCNTWDTVLPKLYWVYQIYVKNTIAQSNPRNYKRRVSKLFAETGPCGAPAAVWQAEFPFHSAACVPPPLPLLCLIFLMIQVSYNCYLRDKCANQSGLAQLELAVSLSKPIRGHFSNSPQQDLKSWKRNWGVHGLQAQSIERPHFSGSFVQSYSWIFQGSIV